jgi:CRP-like cAMP-binding protein
MDVDRYVLETLMPDLVGHDRQPSAFLVYLCLWAATSAGERPVEVSLRQLAESTGLSRRAVQDALDRLAHRELVSVERENITAVARYTIHRPWRRRASSGSPHDANADTT